MGETNAPLSVKSPGHRSIVQLFALESSPRIRRARPTTKGDMDGYHVANCRPFYAILQNGKYLFIFYFLQSGVHNTTDTSK